MSGQDSVPPEAELIRQHREEATPMLSRRQAAARAGLSPSQWGDVERGRKRVGSGVEVPVQATAETLARMARTVGASADDLVTVGREDAARLLLDHDQDHVLRQRLAAIPGLGVLGVQKAPGPGGQAVLPLITDCFDAIDGSDLPSTAKRDITAMFVRGLVRDIGQRRDELNLVLNLANSIRQPN